MLVRRGLLSWGSGSRVSGIEVLTRQREKDKALNGEIAYGKTPYGKECGTLQGHERKMRLVRQLGTRSCSIS